MGTWQALPSAMYRGTGLLTTRGGGLNAAGTGLQAAVASHSRGERVWARGAFHACFHRHLHPEVIHVCVVRHIVSAAKQD